MSRHGYLIETRYQWKQIRMRIKRGTYKWLPPVNLRKSNQQPFNVSIPIFITTTQPLINVGI